MRDNYLNTVQRHISAGYQTLLVETQELHRSEKLLMELPHLDGSEIDAVLTWDMVSGFHIQSIAPAIADELNVPEDLRRAWGKAVHKNPEDAIRTATGALDWLVSLDPEHVLLKMQLNSVVVVLRNMQLFMRSEQNYQRWQNYVYGQRFQTSGASEVNVCRVPVIIGNATEPPGSLEDTIARISFSLPTRTELVAEARQLEAVAIASQKTADPPIIVEPATPERIDMLCRLLLGTQLREASDALSLALVSTGDLSHETVPELLEETKAARFKATHGLHYYPKRQIAGSDTLGGFDAYKAWVTRRKVCFTDAAAQAGIDIPRGVVILGPPGTAKSCAGMVTARILDLPLYELDLGALFGGLVGETESNTRKVLEVIDAVDGCVLLLDEIDKYVAHATQASGDSGVTQRLFGKLLTWLTSKTSNTFVVATANRTTGVPPEFLRRGRFDEIFYTDLPNDAQRIEIAKIHMRKRAIDPIAVFPDDASWKGYLSVTADFTGAEIEQTIKEGKLAAFEQGRQNPTAAELVSMATTLVSSKQLDGDAITAIQSFCRTRARPVSEDRPVAPAVGSSRGPRTVKPPTSAAAKNNT